jgi:hypothetical protein
MRRDSLFLVILALAGVIIPAANAGILFEVSGTSAAGLDVRFTAELSISGDDLTIVLTNNSPVDTLNPADLLSSFYFDIVNTDDQRPELTYISAVGNVYETSKTNPDTLAEVDADIMAVNPGDYSWMFASMDAAANPYLAFGIGTVGNSSMANNFKGNIVGGMDYSIYKGEITTQNLNDRLLVRETATFTFSGLSGFTEDDIAPRFAFGLGTGPDSMLTPEPLTLTMLGLGGLLLRKRAR